MDSKTPSRHPSRPRLTRLVALRLAPLLALSLILASPAVHAGPGDDRERPHAEFVHSPDQPVVGEEVTFTSTSSDPDGEIVFSQWDLDNDRAFDDGTGPSASYTYTSAGEKEIRLRVFDDDNESRTRSHRIRVNLNREPTASFTASTTSPLTDESVELTSTSTDPDGRPLEQEWDLDGDAIFDDAAGETATVSFPDDGTRRVSLRVTDSGGIVRTEFLDLAVRNRRPTAAFALSANEVDTGTAITFTSNSTDPDGSVDSFRWDFDGDGTVDATGPTVDHSFDDDGTPTVSLSVTDDDEATDSVSRQVTIRNRAPAGSFTYAPADPTAGEPVELTSSADDLDGTVVERSWDLDGDGVYGDATGEVVSTVFEDTGAHSVGLKVTDDDGASSQPAVQTINVASDGPGTTPPPDSTPPPSSTPPASFPPPVVNGPPPPDPALPGPRLMDPFPLVRIRGVTTRRGARLDLLSIRTSGGAKIVVRCRGRGCPWARKTRTARFSGARLRAIKMPGFNGRHLRAGTILEVFVMRKGLIGKYTRFKIRRLKAPLRVDGCTAPGVARVRKCSA